MSTLYAHSVQRVLMEVTIGSTKIEFKRAIKYLGVVIDDRLNIKERMKFIGEKAFVTQGAVTKMMPNIGGPNPFKRRIIPRAVTSILFYACPIRSEALLVGTTGRKLFSAYRLNAISQI